jgi:hypothetical protein
VIVEETLVDNLARRLRAGVLVMEVRLVMVEAIRWASQDASAQLEVGQLRLRSSNLAMLDVVETWEMLVWTVNLLTDDKIGRSYCY